MMMHEGPENYPYDDPTLAPYERAPIGPMPSASRRGRRGWSRRTAGLVAGGAALALAAAVGVGIGAGVLPALAASGANTPLWTATHDGRAVSFTASGNGARGAGQWRGAHGGLTVKSVSGGTITATRSDGQTVTIHTTGSTTYTRAGKTVKASAITNGEQIAVRGTRQSDGSITATDVEIVLPHVGGVVTAASGSDITVRDRAGGTITVHTTSATTFTRAGQSATRADVAVGDRISAAGTKNSDNSLTAETVHIVLPHAAGAITAINGSAVTIKDEGGATMIIHTTSSTQFFSVTKGTNGPQRTTIHLSDLKVGNNISAEGTRAADGSLDALKVTAVPNWPQGRHGAHNGGKSASPTAGASSN
jgi:hypothetical protein